MRACTSTPSWQWISRRPSPFSVKIHIAEASGMIASIVPKTSPPSSFILTRLPTEKTPQPSCFDVAGVAPASGGNSVASIPNLGPLVRVAFSPGWRILDCTFTGRRGRESRLMFPPSGIIAPSMSGASVICCRNLRHTVEWAFAQRRTDRVPLYFISLLLRRVLPLQKWCALSQEASFSI